MAFLHHVAAFALVAALAVEFVLIRGELTVATARRLARADMILGISAGVLLAVGLLRVFYFEKGAAYYFHSATSLIVSSVMSVSTFEAFFGQETQIAPSAVSFASEARTPSTRRARLTTKR